MAVQTLSTSTSNIIPIPSAPPRMILVPPMLPKSGLRLAGTRPGALLFKGGRAHG